MCAESEIVITTALVPCKKVTFLSLRWEYFQKVQKALYAKMCAESDIVITTAMVPGKKAPILVTKVRIFPGRAESLVGQDVCWKWHFYHHCFGTRQEA